jgi:hypothetical protein
LEQIKERTDSPIKIDLHDKPGKLLDFAALFDRVAFQAHSRLQVVQVEVRVQVVVVVVAAESLFRLIVFGGDGQAV